MSVIGTTLKQPRVFAHDAVALKDLPGCYWRAILSLSLLEAGSGFAVDTYESWLSTPATTSNAGNGAVINVAVVNGSGEIEEFGIEETCGIGNAYNVGDEITINSPTLGGDPAVFKITALRWDAWDFGCPFTSAYMGSQKIMIEDVTDANFGKPLYGNASYDASATNLGEENVNGELGQIDQLPGFLKKTMYTYTCACENDPCSCTYETPGPGAALYIGAAMASITVVMESGSKSIFYNVPAGSFMPISALTVCAADPDDAAIDPLDVILALF